MQGTGNPDGVGTFSREQGTGEPRGLAPRSLVLRTLFSFLLILGHSGTAWACSVCYGDPESPLTKGALGGVIVLGGIVYTLLLGFVGVGAYWMVRARRAARALLSPDAENEVPR